MPVKKFLKVYLPLLCGFMISKFIAQTDLIMLGYLGTKEVAAFGVPGKLMLFDLIIALSLGPIISIFVSSEKNINRQNTIVGKSLTLTLIISIGLVLMGLLIYPQLLQVLVKDKQVQSMSMFSLILLTCAIPQRMLLFVSAMILHAKNKGYKILYIDSFVFFVNIILNYILMFHYNLGFKGCFISTFISSLIGCVGTLYALKNTEQNLKLFIVPDINWSKKIIHKSSAEWLRLAILNTSSIAVLFIIGKDTFMLASYSSAAEIHHFLLMPIIALMRSVAILSSPTESKALSKRYVLFKNINKVATISVAIICLCILLNLRYIGNSVYLYDGHVLSWWLFYMSFSLVALIFSLKNAFIKGVLQSMQNFFILTKLEFMSKWLIYVPLLYIGVLYKKPIICFSGLLIGEVVEFVILKLKIIKSRVVN